MSVRLPSQNKQYAKLNSRLAEYVAAVEALYDDLCKQTADAVTLIEVDGVEKFKFNSDPILQRKIEDIQQEFVSNLHAMIYSGTSDEWKRSNLFQDLIANKVLKKYKRDLTKSEYNTYYRDNSDALKAFQYRRDRGLNLSQKLWQQSAQLKTEMEDALSCSIEKGIDAVTLSKRLSKYLSDFPSLQTDYKEKFGTASKAVDCEYRSIRLARSEINMAYRTAEQTRWRQFDFVVGYEIKLSHSHPREDVCDRLAGKYPKDFVWSGWHPNCYSDDMEVLSKAGWKLFRDVNKDDEIVTLNPLTRSIEYSRIEALVKYPFHGTMYRFHNRALDCLVTGDHSMVYLSKDTGEIRRLCAKEYRMGNGGFYRSSEYDAQDVASIDIGGITYPFDWFCEFMGYYLADGSIQRHRSGIMLCQRRGEPAYESMIRCIESIGISPKIYRDGMYIFRASLNRYLEKFGRCNEKYVPDEIMHASRRQIKIFLDAFIKCDGHVRKPHSFIGNRGSAFTPTHDERMYFTTSKVMAGNLCEMIVKVGNRPSYEYRTQCSGGTSRTGKKIVGKLPLYSIRECLGKTATVFNKTEVEYSGMVYDITLAQNHIMYVSRNGKCFWGSNCMDYCIPILKSEEEFLDDSITPKNEVSGVPQAFNDWCQEYKDTIEVAYKRGTLPYFLKDNPKYLMPQFGKQSKIYESILHLQAVDIVKASKTVGDDFQSIAFALAKKYGGTVTPLNYKSVESIERKCKTDDTNPSFLKDVVRTTIIVPKEHINHVLQELQNDSIFFRLKRQTPDKFDGYSGNIVNVRHPRNGAVGEIQVNTAKMIYGKETEDNARRILGDSLWEKIKEETGLQGGLGHKYYEEIRVLDVNIPAEKAKYEALRKAMKEYYSHFNT